MTLGIRGGFRNPLVDGAFIIDGSVGSDQLADGAVITAKLAALAVDAAKLGNSSVTAVKIANLAVGTAAIQNLAVSNAKIADLAVNTAKIADLAVSNAKIADLAVNTAKIANLAVTDAKIDTLSATKITSGTINTGTITVASELRMSAGAEIKFTRNSSATISTNHSPQNGDLWIEYRGNDAGAIIGLKRTSGVELVAGQLNVTADGFDFATGDVQIRGNSGQRLFGNVNSATASTTTPRFVFDSSSGWGWFATSSMWSLILQRNSDGEALRIYRTSTLTGSIGTTSGTLTLYASSSQIRTISILNGGSGSSVYFRDGLTDVGNHETLRMNRGTGSTVAPIGYYSSNRKDKREIVPLSRSKLWKTEWFDQLEPVKYRRRSTQGREFGFVLDDIAEVSKYLTTKGDSVGHSLDEFALLAVTVDAVKDLRTRVRELESDLKRLRRGRLSA